MSSAPFESNSPRFDGSGLIGQTVAYDQMVPARPVGTNRMYRLPPREPVLVTGVDKNLNSLVVQVVSSSVDLLVPLNFAPSPIEEGGIS